MEFYNDFEQNLKLFKDAFEKDTTFKIKYIKNKNLPDLRIAIAVVNCMVSNDVVDRDIIKPLCNNMISPDIEFVICSAVTAHTAVVEKDVTNALVSVAGGDCAIIIDNNPSVIVIDAKGMKQRDVSAPETELSVAGPGEGFNENIMTSLSLLKKRLATPKLKSEFMMSGKQSNSRYCICYLEGVVRPELVQRLKKRLEKIDIDYLGDSSYIAEFVQDNKTSFIKTYGKTNRPDVLAAKLLEGRVGIIFNGSPTALTFPFIFIENFQTPDDYYLNCYYANVGRALRFIGFFISFLLPSAYISILLHHPSMLPHEWLYSISASQTGVPIPSLLEMVLLFGIFEALRETGARMPSSFGLALNIVGAVVLGQAAVDARLVSAPMVIVVSFSGIAGLMVYHLKGAVFYLRIVFILLGALAGLPGVAIAFALFLLLLYNMSSLGVPIMTAFSPFDKYSKSDTFFRMPMYKMNFRQSEFSENTKRQGRV